MDLFGRIVDSRWFNTSLSTDVDRIKYGYDRASNRIWRQNPVATANGAHFDEHYTNDGLQRLKDMQRGTLNGTNTAITSPTFAQCWTLDPTGNWRGFNEAATGGAWTLNQTRTANTVNEITGITKTVGATWANPAYDPAGNMTTMPQPANPSATYTATYDAWNRLITLASGGTTVQQNQYDARNFRTIRITNSPSETRHFFYTKGWRCIEEHLGSATTPDTQSVWGARYIDDLVRRDRSTDQLYALQDANWNVTSIVDIAGAVKERYSYSAYGIPTFLTGSFGARSTSSVAWETLYCSYRYDSAMGLFHVRFRMYQPLLGNWCQRDPVGYRDGANVYEYVVSTPVRSTDSHGLEVFICFRAFQDQSNGPYFRQKTWATGGPIAHVFLSVVEDDGTVTTLSFHPDEFLANANKRRPGRVWKNDPRDLNCSSGTSKSHMCYDIPKLKGKEKQFLSNVETSIFNSGVGFEEGKGDPKTERTKSHRDPSESCTMDYWVLGQNCAWWATSTIVDAGEISSEDLGAERFNERVTGMPWNKNQGIYTFADPEGEGGLNGNPALPRPQQFCRPGCFKSDLPRPKK